MEEHGQAGQGKNEKGATEQALRLSEARLREAQRLAGIGSWELDLLSDSFLCSEETCRMLARAPQDLQTCYESFLSCVYPQDRSRVHHAFTRAVESSGEYDVEHRLLLSDADVRFVRQRGEVLRDDAGRAVKVVGTLQDITEQYLSDRRIHLLAMSFERSCEAKLICDAGNRILAVNEAFERLTGYTRGEVIGCDPRILSSGDMPAQLYRDMWRNLEVEGAWQGEIIDRRKDGSTYPKWLSISVVRDEEGRVSHYLGSFLDISERKSAQAKLEYLAHFDSLTGLPNRFSLEARLDQVVLTARRDGLGFALMFIDLDGFKNINDSLGHSYGDDVLKEIARRLGHAVREADVVARLGGDEFVVLLSPPCAERGDVVRIAEKLLGQVTQPIQLGERMLHVSASIGISLFPEDAHCARELLQHADAAMYQAKAQRREGYHFFSTELQRRATARLEMENFLREVLLDPQSESLQLHYQPQFAAGGKQLVGFEALLRMHHPLRGLISPAEVIPVAEETGLIHGLGSWVMRESCRQIRAWQDQGRKPVKVSVNLSSRQFRQNDLEQCISRNLDDFAIPPELLMFEVTESAAMEQPERVEALMRRLKKLGVGLSIDDFGTGYSSLSYLRRLPLDMLKIDRSFVLHLETEQNDGAIASATIALAHKLGLHVVGEGVETEFQSRFLREQGCDWLQGFLFARPMSAEAATQLLATT